MTSAWSRIRMVEKLKADHAKQNAQINLLQNWRHRIGRDLHDSLGHTFAMLSAKGRPGWSILSIGSG